MDDVDLLLAGGRVYRPDGRVRAGGVAVRGDHIVAAGPDVTADAYAAGTTIDTTGCLVLPGLVNSHTHETLPRGFHEDLPLMEWLETSTLPAERALTPEWMRAAARLNQVELVRSGTTTFAEIFRHQDEAAAVAVESGLRARFAAQVIDDPELETLAANREVYEAYDGAADGRIGVWVGFHAPYTCSEATIREAGELARELDTRLHTHLAETEAETEQIREEAGARPVAYLDDLGVLTERLHAAHCVHLTDGEIATLADRGVTAAYNPVSNMKLADGVAPVPDLLAAGVPVGLATDSNLSNNNLDMFEEMRVGSYLQKLHRSDPAAMSYDLLLDLATDRAADALGLPDVGRIEPGAKADLITVDLGAPHLRPAFAKDDLDNLVANVVYAGRGSDVRDTVVDGEVLMRDRELLTLDEETVLADAQTAARELHAAVERRQAE